MKTRKELTQKVCQHYRMAGTKEKTAVLTEFVHADAYDQSYAAVLIDMLRLNTGIESPHQEI